MMYIELTFDSHIFLSLGKILFCCSLAKPVLDGFSFWLPFLDKTSTMRLVFVSASTRRLKSRFAFCNTVPG